MSDELKFDLYVDRGRNAEAVVNRGIEVVSYVAQAPQIELYVARERLTELEL